jgi:GST-like protein
MRLLTAGTPNGWKATIMIEELIEEGVLKDEVKIEIVDLLDGEQFGEEFTRFNPNQKIPVLIDQGYSVMESCAILNYLAEKYSSKMLPAERQTRWDVLQWLYWQAANIGPVFGNKLSYTRYLESVPDIKKEHPLERFGKEARRLTAVLDHRLQGRDFVCGDEYSIADISIYPWLRGWKWSKVNIEDRENVRAWMSRVRSRPAVERGLSFGSKAGEVDQWSKETKLRYAREGSELASNNVLKEEL